MPLRYISQDALPPEICSKSSTATHSSNFQVLKIELIIKEMWEVQ